MFRGLRKKLGICTLKDYLSKDENGLTYLERLLKDGKKLDYNQELKLMKSIDAGYIYAKYDKSLCCFDYTEEQLFTKINNEYFIEYLLSKNKCSSWMVEVITDHIEFIDLLIKYDKYSLIWINKELVNKLLVKNDNNNYLIEKYIKDETVMRMLLNKCENAEILIEIIEKINNKNILNGRDKEVLLNKTKSGKTVLEYLLEKKLINRIDLKILLNKYNKNKTYLDYILEMIKEGKIKYNLTNISLIGCDISDKVMFYIILAKYDMMKYIENLTEEDLLKKDEGKTLLEELINKDKDLTLNKILTEKAKSNIKIAIILKSKGILVNDVDIPLKDFDVTSDYLRNRQMRYGIGPLYEKGDYLLNKLQNLFLNDGKSDKDLVMSLICGYRQALITNYDIFIKELELLVKIKEKHLDMYYIKINNGGYFKRITGSIYSDEFNVDTILHETGHAFHSYICRSKYPDNLEEILDRVRNDKNIIYKVEKLSKEYYVFKEQLYKLVELECFDYFNNYYTKEKNIEIDNILSNLKEEKKKEYSNLGVDDKKLDSILNEVINKDEYIKTKKRNFVSQYFSAIKTEKCGSIMAILDIIDGIFEGDYYSGNLVNRDGKLIKGTVGHGIPYYSCDLDNIFCEMIADFSTISKSYNSYIMLELLKDIIGVELYNLLSDYYYNNIIGIENRKKVITL